jgi:LmbE family N-acetylglucosaminyl deacetylase
MTEVLVIAPHPDDESLGCGGTISLLCRRGDLVQVVFLTSGERGVEGLPPQEARALREAEARQAGAVLGVNHVAFLRLPDGGVAGNIEPGGARLAQMLGGRRPGLLFLPHPGDEHADHKAALPLVAAAWRTLPGGPPPQLWGYEVWTPLASYGWAEDVSPVMAQKLRAVRCHRSQLGSFRYDRAVRGLNQYRGALAARCRYAEVFQLLDIPAPARA